MHVILHSDNENNYNSVNYQVSRTILKSTLKMHDFLWFESSMFVILNQKFNS